MASNPEAARHSLEVQRCCPTPVDHRYHLIRRFPLDKHKTYCCRYRPRTSLKYEQFQLVDILLPKKVLKKRRRRSLTFGQGVVPGGRLGSGKGSSPRGTSRSGRGPGDLEGFRAFVSGDTTLLQKDFVTELLRQGHHLGEVFGW